MYISLKGYGLDPDDKLVEFTFTAETKDFKGTTTFFGYSNSFHDFAKQLFAFPFESNRAVNYINDVSFSKDSTNLISVELLDPAGHINFTVHVEDDLGNYAKFSDETIEVESLHVFARKLLAADFDFEAEVSWSSLS